METKYGLCFLLTAVGSFLPGKLKLSIYNQSNSGIYKMRPSHGFGGTGGTGGKAFISGEQGNKGQILRRTKSKDNIGEQGT